MRADLEQKICEALGVPGVQIVVQGGQGTFTTVCETLERGMQAAVDCLRPGGRLAVISFHSVEDRVVKRFVRDHLDVVTKKPITATPAEARSNPRSRSAKLRCGIKREEQV